MRRLIIAVALVCSTASATDLPVSAGRDQRILRANYHADDVVHVFVDAASRITQIVLEDGEVVMSAIPGSPDGYEIIVAHNVVTVRPVSVKVGEVWVDPNQDWNTNLSIITASNRIYWLDLEISNTPAYMVKYYYPTEAEEAREVAAEQTAAAAIKAEPEIIIAKNLNYDAAQGDVNADSIMPRNTFDNGSHTFIEFYPYSDMPAVSIGAGEDETKAISEVEDERPNTIRVKTIAEKITLRKGRKVVTITNLSFPKVQH